MRAAFEALPIELRPSKAVEKGQRIDLMRKGVGMAKTLSKEGIKVDKKTWSTAAVVAGAAVVGAVVYAGYKSGWFDAPMAYISSNNNF